MKNVFVTLICISISLSGFSQTLKDSIIFRNGNRLQGEVKRVKLGVVTFDPDDANDVTVRLRNLKSITAISTVFRIETIDQMVYFGKLLPHPLDKYAYILQAGDSIDLFLENISAMYPFHNEFWNRFSGSVGFGYSYTRSSNFGRINFDGKVNYLAKLVEINFSATGIYTITDTSTTRDREEVPFKFNYYFSGTWFLTAMFSYQRNLELGLQRRYQEGLGIGNKFLRRQTVYAWARSGIVLNQERNTENQSSGTLAEIFGQLQFNFFRFTKPEINFNLSQAFYYSLSQAGRFRNDGQTDLTWEVFKDFDLNLSFYNNYDSKPPVAESRKLDFGIVFGFAFSF